MRRKEGIKVTAGISRVDGEASVVAERWKARPISMRIRRREREREREERGYSIIRS